MTPAPVVSPAPLLGALAADALALGPHWIYSQDEIAARFGRVDRFHPPLSRYHPDKQAGDFTHYGDQLVVFLRSLARTGTFVPSVFMEEWRAHWDHPATVSYRDGATRSVLEQLRSGTDPLRAAAPSHDLGGTARTPALFLLPWPDDDHLADAARHLAALTHADPDVSAAAACFALAAAARQRGVPMPEALRSAVTRAGTASLASWLAAAEASAASRRHDAAALAEIGLACGVDEAFTGTCHLLLRHPDNPESALSADANAGGDSAARGLMLGMVLGAAGLDAFPCAWLEGLRARPAIDTLVAAVAAQNSIR